MLVLFDVDGTLTPSRGQIDAEFKHWLMHEARFDYEFVTGSDPDKTREQIGDDLWSSTVCYNCCGNHIFDHGREVYRSDWRLPADAEAWLEEHRLDSLWRIQTGRHLEHRVGLCNFSVVGRAATLAQRRLYYDWDCDVQERMSLALELNRRWPELECTVAGETGMDIYARGCGKSQVAELVRHRAPILFYGDRVDPGGNDHGLAVRLAELGIGQGHQVQGWQDTWQRLRELDV